MIVANIRFRSTNTQLIFWNPFDAEDREHIGFGYGRWPGADTLAEIVKNGGWTDFGFHGLVCGPFEVRYWPHQRFYGQLMKEPRSMVRTDIP